MLNLGSYELTHPELLSELQLHEILKNSCIENLNFEKLCKSELLEMYKRVAMPLPQRQRGSVKELTEEVKMISEELVSIEKYGDTHSSNENKGNNRMQSVHSPTDKEKPIVNDSRSVASKKMRICSSQKTEAACNGISKRRCDEQNEESLTKKRQKITWP